MGEMVVHVPTCGSVSLDLGPVIAGITGIGQAPCFFLGVRPISRPWLFVVEVMDTMVLSLYVPFPDNLFLVAGFVVFVAAGSHGGKHEQRRN